MWYPSVISVLPSGPIHSDRCRRAIRSRNGCTRRRRHTVVEGVPPVVPAHTRVRNEGIQEDTRALQKNDELYYKIRLPRVGDGRSTYYFG